MEDNDYSIVLLTCKASIGKYINTKILSTIKLDTKLNNVYTIIGIRSEFVCKGVVSQINTKDFNSQCTFIIKNINTETNTMLKVFNSGDIIITGNTNIDEIKIIIDLFKTLIKKCKIEISLKQLVLHGFTTQAFIDFVRYYFSQIMCLYAKFNVHVDDILIACLDKPIHTRNTLNEDPTRFSESWFQTHFSPESLRLFQIFTTAIYYTKINFIYLLEIDKKFLQLLTRLYNSKSKKLSCTIDANKGESFVIENVNLMFENNYTIDKNSVSQVLKRYYKDRVQYMLYDPSIYRYILIRWKYNNAMSQCSVTVYDKKIIICGYKTEDKTNFKPTIVSELKNIFKTHRSELELRCNISVTNKMIHMCQDNVNQSKTLCTKYNFEDRAVIRSKYFMFVSKRGFEMNPRNYFYSRFNH